MLSLFEPHTRAIPRHKRAYDLYRRLAEEKYGYEARPEQLAFCVPCYVAESDDIAMQEAEHYILP